MGDKKSSIFSLLPLPRTGLKLCSKSVSVQVGKRILQERAIKRCKSMLVRVDKY